MRAIVLFIFLATVGLCSGCVPFPHSEEPLVVYGEVIDNQNLRPLPGVAVSVKFPKNFGYKEDETNKTGKFNVPSHGGWLYTVSMFPDEDFSQVRIRATIEHPDYQIEEIDEVFPVEGDSPPKINLGTIYLDRK